MRVNPKTLHEAEAQGVQQRINVSGVKHKRMRFAIYALVHPLTHFPHYIGITEMPARRLRQHVIARDTSTALGRWVEVLQYNGLYPILKVILRTDDVRNRNVIERNVIAAYAVHYRLFNTLGRRTEATAGIPYIIPPSQFLDVSEGLETHTIPEAHTHTNSIHGAYPYRPPCAI
jgi:hypothetical protein